MPSKRPGQKQLIPTAPPPLPNMSAPPLPTSAPPLPSGTPPSFANNQSSAVPPPPPPGPPPPPSLPSTGKQSNNTKSAPALSGGLPFLNEINNRRDDTYVVDDDKVNKVSNTSHSSAAPPSIPSIPSFSAPTPPALPTMAPPVPAVNPPPVAPPPPITSSAPPPAAPPAPPAPPSLSSSVSLPPPPPGPPPPPSFKNTANKAPTPAVAAGGLPFLAEINQRRNDSYVIDEKDVSKKASKGISAPSEQDKAIASAPKPPSSPSAPVPSGNPLMDEIMKRSHKSNNSITQIPSSSAPKPPSLPIGIPPSLPSGIPPAPPAPPSLPSAAPSIPVLTPPSAPPAPPPGFGVPGITVQSSVPPTPPAPAPPAPSLPSTAPPAPPSLTPSYKQTSFDDSDTMSVFSNQTSMTSGRKKAPPPPPPSSTTNQYSNTSLTVDTQPLNITPASHASPLPLQSKTHIPVGEDNIFSSIKSKFGSGFRGHHKSKSGIAYEQKDQILQTQVAGNEIRKIDISAYTISGSMNKNGNANVPSSSSSGFTKMESSRFKFLEQNEIPKPHKFQGRIKLYPSGRGSSIPLDLSRLT